jgi:toxin CcdB
MPQFDVYRNPSVPRREEIPFLLDLQNELLSDLATRVVAPLYRADAYGPAARHLNPVFSVQGVRVVMSSAELAAIPRRLLRSPVTTLASGRSEIVRALDFLFLGL